MILEELFMNFIFNKKSISFFLVVLFIGIPLLGLITSDLNESPQELSESQIPKNTYESTLGAVDNLGESYLNIAGFQEGSVFTYSTLGTRFTHTCAILDDGSVSCWGNNGQGQLGDGTNTDKNTPTQTSSLGADRTAVAITVGTSHTCAILDDGSVSCWGGNGFSQLGDGTTTDRNTPTQISTLGTDRTAVAISAGYAHTCAILDDGSVSCWGDNDYGQIGDGTTTNRNTPTQTSSLGTDRTAWRNIKSIQVSERDYDNDGILNIFDQSYLTCSIGTYSSFLKLGVCTDASAGYYVPDSRNHNSNKISTGTTHTCTILDDGSVSCWGDNSVGPIGDGTTTDRSTPTQTSSLGTDRTAVAIAAGWGHTCVILDDGSVSCWGDNSDGQLGDGTTTDRLTPTPTSSLGFGRTAVAIATGQYHTCVILDDGSVSCWGRNDNGRLGDGTTTDRLTPTQTSSLGIDRTAVAIDLGNYHTCAILDDGSVSCWGQNIKGQLGDGTNTDRNTPTQISSLGTDRTAVSIAVGYRNTCVILDDGSVSCWGNNNYGQLGDGTTTNRNTPTQTSSLGTDRTAVAINAGIYQTCAILDDGSVSCWGYNSDGQLGDGTNTLRNTPTQTSSLGTDRTAVAISAGGYHTCAILDDGYVSCWGGNGTGQLGDGTRIDRNTPTAI